MHEKLAREELEHLRVDTPVPESQPTGALTNGTTSNAPATIKNVVPLAAVLWGISGW